MTSGDNDLNGFCGSFLMLEIYGSEHQPIENIMHNIFS